MLSYSGSRRQSRHLIGLEWTQLPQRLGDCPLPAEVFLNAPSCPFINSPSSGSVLQLLFPNEDETPSAFSFSFPRELADVAVMALQAFVLL